MVDGGGRTRAPVVEGGSRRMRLPIGAPADAGDQLADVSDGAPLDPLAPPVHAAAAGPPGDSSCHIGSDRI